jgi:hypothetical protein
MSNNNSIISNRPRFGQTSRTDAWWLYPLLVFLGFSAFIIYATWSGLQGNHYRFEGNGSNYLSPFYSPEIFGSAAYPTHHGLLGDGVPGWWPSILPFSTAFFIVWIPAGFRLTCYYYRGAYYKAFWADPVACGVGEPRHTYLGENSFPLIMQNIHRYFLYLALVFIVILAKDAYEAMWFIGTDGVEHFGIGLGTLILTTNVILIAGYTLGCHSLRHLVGGGLDILSKHPIRKQAYNCSTCLNKKHMLWAWLSLFMVGFSDFYVRMLDMGIFSDWRIL